MSLPNFKQWKLICFFVLTLFFACSYVEGWGAPFDRASFPLPQSIAEAQSSLDWKGWFTIFIVLFTFWGLVTEFRPPDVVMFLSTGILVIAGILTPGQFLEGFANDVLVTIAMLCIIVRSLEINGVLEVVGRKVLTNSKNYAVQIFSLFVPVSVASAFLNNTPVVLLMTPLVRRWALKNKSSPSQFLLPLSYAALLGGLCTLIGTSTNLVVYGVLRRFVPEAEFSFFELGYVGVPVAVCGLVYLMLFGKYLLPARQDPKSALKEETREFTAEFVIEKGCPLVNREIGELSKKYFQGISILQIERNKMLIDSPSPDLTLYIGDRVVFAGDINAIAQLHTIDNLVSQADPHFKLDVTSSHFTEIVIPSTSIFIGKTVRQLNFRRNYGASVIAVYRQGWRIHGNVRDIVLQAGDTLMMLSGEPWEGGTFPSKDFLYIRHHEKLLVFNRFRALLVLLALAGVVIAATLGIPIMVSSLCGAFFLLLTRTISIREAQNSIMWSILLLIACSLALARAMETTGAAAYFGQMLISVVGDHPYALIGGILLVTSLCTEVMTNNAAALIIFPIAFEAAYLAGYQSIEAAKTIGITVAIGASCAFSVPTGYQTHLIVYGPGGYKFSDFVKIGLPMNVLMWGLATLLIPIIWPLSQKGL